MNKQEPPPEAANSLKHFYQLQKGCPGAAPKIFPVQLDKMSIFQLHLFMNWPPPAQFDSRLTLSQRETNWLSKKIRY